ncbi:MAG TPA: ribonuclease H-like domain-containing protein [Blastocatellia bacterium]|nr:ribonuclease H-like domain-containing protein [Blastocatellia bacterium]
MTKAKLGQVCTWDQTGWHSKPDELNEVAWVCSNLGSLSATLSQNLMLENTFCHVPGIGLATERKLWSAGILNWEDSLGTTEVLARILKKRTDVFRQRLDTSRERLEKSDVRYFSGVLHPRHHWRLFPHFRHSIAYIDIETTGLWAGDAITTIALYDGQSIFHYVNGDNLDQFRRDIRDYDLIVTYNGKGFDVPMLENYFDMRLRQAHIDLRYVLESLGYHGGLKICESELGIDRGSLDGVDGYFAIWLWYEFRRNNNPKALETLLAYNIQDVLNLETLLTMAYNLEIEDTPFRLTLHLPTPLGIPNPFKPDMRTIDRIMYRTAGIAYAS